MPVGVEVVVTPPPLAEVELGVVVDDAPPAEVDVAPPVEVGVVDDDPSAVVVVAPSAVFVQSETEDVDRVELQLEAMSDDGCVPVSTAALESLPAGEAALVVESMEAELASWEPSAEVAVDPSAQALGVDVTSRATSAPRVARPVTRHLPKR